MGILLNTATSAARDGILSTREVGQLVSKALEDGKLSRSEVSDLKKIQTDLYNELTPEARKAIRNFLSMGTSFDPAIASQLFGVSDELADKLEKADVKSANELLLASKTPADRTKLAGLAGLDEVVVTSLAEQADLARVLGIGPKYAAMLQKIGINDVRELSEQNGVALRRQITSFLKTTEGREVTSRRPSLATVKKWIDSAKTLPRMLTHLGDSGADFNKAAFDALDKNQRHMLLMGYDVRLDSGFVFDNTALAISGVAADARPAGLDATVKKQAEEAFGGEYESAELSSLEEIKVGDEVLGYRASFDVVGEGEVDSEAGPSGDVRMRGTVDVTYDATGKVISSEAYLDYDTNAEG